MLSCSVDPGEVLKAFMKLIHYDSNLGKFFEFVNNLDFSNPNLQLPEGMKDTVIEFNLKEYFGFFIRLATCELGVLNAIKTPAKFIPENNNNIVRK